MYNLAIFENKWPIFSRFSFFAFPKGFINQKSIIIGKEMKIAQIGTSFIYDGISAEIFISGCRHSCKGCQNPLLQDFNYGKEMTIYQILEEIAFRKKWTGIDSIVLTGGDPLWSEENTHKLILAIKNEFPELKIWLYTGFTKEEIDSNRNMVRIFNLCDVVVTDRYEEKLRFSDKELQGIDAPRKMAGSSNQRIWKK